MLQREARGWADASSKSAGCCPRRRRVAEEGEDRRKGGVLWSAWSFRRTRRSMVLFTWGSGSGSTQVTQPEVPWPPFIRILRTPWPSTTIITELQHPEVCTRTPRKNVCFFLRIHFSSYSFFFFLYDSRNERRKVVENLIQLVFEFRKIIIIIRRRHFPTLINL